MKIKLLKTQIIKAKKYLNTNEGFKNGQTKNYYFETNDKGFVFEIEKPAKNVGRLDAVLRDFTREVLEIEFMELSGHNSRNQYISPWTGCYIWKRDQGYSRKGAHYFDYLE